MRSDNLIKKVLMAAVIVEGVHFALTLILCAAADLLTSGYMGRAIGGFYDNDAKLTFPIPCFFQAAVLTGVFFLVWTFLRNGILPQKYSPAGGILLVVLYIMTTFGSTAVNIAIRYYANRYGAAYLSKISIFYGTILGPARMLHSVAVILLFIAFGMEWYRASLIREQTIMAQQGTVK